MGYIWLTASSNRLRSNIKCATVQRASVSKAGSLRHVMSSGGTKPVHTLTLYSKPCLSPPDDRWTGTLVCVQSLFWPGKYRLPVKPKLSFGKDGLNRTIIKFDGWVRFECANYHTPGTLGRMLHYIIMRVQMCLIHSINETLWYKHEVTCCIRSRMAEEPWNSELKAGVWKAQPILSGLPADFLHRLT